MFLKQALNHGLVLKQVQRVIKFNQKVWLKPYIDMKTELRRNAKNDFEKYFFRLMNNSVFGNTMENMIKHRYFKLVTTTTAKALNYHTTKNFLYKFISHRNLKNTDTHESTSLFRSIKIIFKQISSV